MKQLVSTDWLEKNIDKVKIFDASWHLPNSNRKAEEEYKLNHIEKLSLGKNILRTETAAIASAFFLSQNIS